MQDFLPQFHQYRPAHIECPQAAKAISAGDKVEVDFDSGVITNITRGEVYKGQSFPPFMQDIIQAGGLVAYINAK